MTPELTEERICVVVSEHKRLMRKLKRMPGGTSMLAPSRLPDLGKGETLLDVVLPQISAEVRAVMDALEALRPEYLRIQELYMKAVWAAARGVEAGSPSPATPDEVRAVLGCAAEIERAGPGLKRFREVAERGKRV